MASNARVAKPGPLSFMTKLTPNVYLYRPESSASPTVTTTTKTPPPKLVLICSWMDARDLHIAKYIPPYQALYPTAQILVIKGDLKHFLFPSAAYPNAVAAVPVIRAAIDASDPTPQLAVHLFSNGGSSMLRHLYRAYQETAKPGEATILPLHTTILDSSPGEHSWSRSITAMTAGLPPLMKWVLGPVIRLYLLSYVLWTFIRPGPDFLQVLALSHNAPTQVKEVRRTYMYSEEDEMVDWKVVEKYAKDAEEKGFAVRKEKFTGSPHVAHVRVDENKYWTAVKETWEGVD